MALMLLNDELSEEIDLIIKSLKSKNVREVEKAYNTCLKLSEQAKRSLNLKLVPELHSKDIAYRNLISEILLDTIKTSPELIKENYDDPSADFRIHLITIAKDNHDETIKQFFSEMIYSEPEPKVRLELADALGYYRDDLEVYNHLIAMYKVETDIATFILQLLGNFNLPVCRNFLFNELVNETNEARISILIYSLSNIDSTQVVLNYLVNDINRHAVWLQFCFLKGIIKIADNNSLSIPENEYLKFVAEKLLDREDAEEAYMYVFLHLDSLDTVSFDYFLSVIKGVEVELIARMLKNIKMQDEAFFTYFKKTMLSSPNINMLLKSKYMKICEDYALI